jgi:hypothetical protein
MPLGSGSLLISGPPISGESFFGYILRLTQWNSYNRISWILNRVGIRFNSVNGWKFEGSVDLLPLARLTGADRTGVAVVYRDEPALEENGTLLRKLPFTLSNKKDIAKALRFVSWRG